MSIPSLFFNEGGWCEALKDSYRPGHYQPLSIDEFKALAPFAVDAPELEEGGNTVIVPPDFDVDACEDKDQLADYAKSQGIKFHPKAGLDKIREAVKAALVAQA